MFSLKEKLIYLVNKIPLEFVFKWYFDYFNSSNMGMVVSLHRVTDSNIKSEGFEINRAIEITEDRLEKLIMDLKRIGALFVSIRELMFCLNSGKKINAPVVHFSFDDGYLDNYTLAYPLLKKYKIPFSIFISSDFINNDQPFLWWYIIEGIIKNEMQVSFERYNFSITKQDYHTKNKNRIFEDFRTFILENVDSNRNYFEHYLMECVHNIAGFSLPKMMKWDDVNTMVSSGLCELGVHTKTHARFKNLTESGKIKEILDCKNVIKLNTAIVPEYFAYPYGSKEDIGSTACLNEILTHCGINLAFTTVPNELNRNTHKFFMPRVFINNTSTMYSLKERLNGTYQKEVSKKLNLNEWDI